MPCQQQSLYAKGRTINSLQQVRETLRLIDIRDLWCLYYMHIGYRIRAPGNYAGVDGVYKMHPGDEAVDRKKRLRDGGEIVSVRKPLFLQFVIPDLIRDREDGSGPRSRGDYVHFFLGANPAFCSK